MNLAIAGASVSHGHISSFTKLYSLNGPVRFTPAGNKGSCDLVHVRSVTGARATRICKREM